MRFLYFIFLVLLIASCAQKNMEIKTSGAENAGVKTANIRTTGIDIEDNEMQAPKNVPAIEITSPEDGQSFENSTILVRLNITNFKLVSADRYPQKNQGHVQVRFDGMESRGSETEFIFENESNGMHTIKAELMMSNNTILTSSKTIKIFINNKIQRQNISKLNSIELNPSEFTVEADDRGFYPDKIQAKLGDKIKINFKFRDASIYFAGLDIKGPFPDIKYKLKQEQPLSAEFTMKGETKITSWWPSSGVKKAELIVEVEE